jgi:hypothetical protein
MVQDWNRFTAAGRRTNNHATLSLTALLVMLISVA